MTDNSVLGHPSADGASTDDSFHLDVLVERADVVEWLRSLPADRVAPEVEKALAAGNFVLSLLSASAGEESMQRFFRPVVEKMEDLRGVMDGMLRAASKSQKLGELGESIVHQQLQTAFPGDKFDLVSKEGHQADLHGHFTVPDGRARKALIEVKLYSNDVPTQELEKFRRDLAQTGTRYGLMVSLGSRMMGISGPVHLEETDTSVAVYVPNAGLDGHGVLWGAALLKSVVLYEHRAEQVGLIRTGAIERAWARLQEELDALKSVVLEVRGLREALGDARFKVIKSLDEVAERALSAQIRLDHAFDRISARLTEELHSLPQTSEPAALPAPSSPDAVLAFIEAARSAKDKRVPSFERLYDLAAERGIDVAIAEDGRNWLLLRDGSLVAKTAGTKTRLDLLATVDEDEPVTLLPRVESVKEGAVLVDGGNRDLWTERARVWLERGSGKG